MMKIKDNFILKEIAGSYVVVPVRSRAVDFSGVIKLTESGAFLWRLLEKGADREELVAALLDEYEVDEVCRAINNGEIQCESMSHERILYMMNLMDSIRAQMGIKYPFE